LNQLGKNRTKTQFMVDLFCESDSKKAIPKQSLGQGWLQCFAQ
jgi:hypothetical protein